MSINDVRKVSKSILNSSFLSPAQTWRWPKPMAFTSSVNVGAPWEIFCASSNRTSGVYTKLGDLGAYSSEIALLLDYDVDLTVLAAGNKAHNTVRILSGELPAF